MIWSKLCTIVRVCAAAIPGNALVRHSLCIASARVAEILARLINSGAANDLARVRENFHSRMDAKTTAEEAKAVKLLAEAEALANQANLPRRRDAFAKLERRKQELENAKIEAEIEAVKAKFETDRVRATAEAQSRLLEAIARIQSEGGSVAFDLENLHTILSQVRGLPSPSDE